MKQIIPILILGFCHAFLAPTAKAQDGSVVRLLLKNNGTLTGNIWVNGKYQGYVRPGRVCDTVAEGFVTSDSGVQSDGSIKQTYAYGGWKSDGGPVHVRIVQIDDDGKIYFTSLDVTGDDSKYGYVWFGEKEAGPEPDALVWERATAIPNGSAPSFHPTDQAAKGTAETKKQLKLAGTWIRSNISQDFRDSNDPRVRGWLVMGSQVVFQIDSDMGCKEYIFVFNGHDFQYGDAVEQWMSNPDKAVFPDQVKLQACWVGKISISGDQSFEFHIESGVRRTTGHLGSRESFLPAQITKTDLASLAADDYMERATGDGETISISMASNNEIVAVFGKGTENESKSTLKRVRSR